jgi:hypothetical protein
MLRDCHRRDLLQIRSRQANEELTTAQSVFRDRLLKTRALQHAPA